MTKEELRKDPEYIKSKEKIVGYKKGFKFKIPFYKMSIGQKNAMNILLNDCIDEQLIDSISFDLDLQGNITEEEYIRL